MAPIRRAAFCDLGLIDYARARELQIALVDSRWQGGEEQDWFLLLEHPPVFTLGRRGGRENLRVSEAFLQSQQVEVVAIERGGDITYHGPGQLVLYPIISLRRAKLSVKEYIGKLEEIMLRTTADAGVDAVRDHRNHGIWVDNRKLGSIGVAIRHGITFHGLSLNVNNSLQPFSWVNPCGLSNVQMTSLAELRGRAMPMDKVKLNLRHHVEAVLNTTLQDRRIAEQ